MVDASDYDLLQRWRSGDADAGSRLVERQFSTVFRFFRRKVADAEVWPAWKPGTELKAIRERMLGTAP